MIQSDSFFRYPKVAGTGGIVNNGGQTLGVLAGTAPPSPANNPSLPVIITGAAVTLKSTTLGTPTTPTAVSQPAGTTISVKYVQVVNNSAGFIFVAQGVELGLVPPFTASAYILPSTVGAPIQLAGWDGGDNTLTDTIVPVLVLWASNKFSNDVSWNGQKASGGGGGGFVGVPYDFEQSVNATVVYGGFVDNGTQGVVDSWSVTMDPFTQAVVSTPPVAAGKIGQITGDINPTLNIVGAAIPFTVEVVDPTLGAMSPITFVAPDYSGSLAAALTATEVAVTLAAPIAGWSFELTLTQPPGSASVGTGALVNALMTVFQVQLQA